MHQNGPQMPHTAAAKPRIIDIALQAGLSTATVDRVLNGRPGVREKTIAKVHEAMADLGRAAAPPQVIPSLATDLTIDVVIAGHAGFANDILASELRSAASARGIEPRMEFPRRMNPAAQADALRQCLERGSDGVILQALEHPQVRELSRELGASGIPVIPILTSLPGPETIGYVGLDNRAAGRTAGLLMGRLARPGEIAVFVGGHLYRSHEEREMGFRAVIREEFPGLTALQASVGQDDPALNHEMACALLEERPRLSGIFNLGGGNRGIEKALKESGRAPEITYVAFNLTPLTRQALLEGTMDAVVHQDFARAADTAIGALVDHTTGRQPAFAPVPVEIIMRENLR